MDRAVAKPYPTAPAVKKNIHFAELAPFLGLFREGVPVICYHKVGRKPLRAKLRGIYVTRGLFRRQMRALREAGFRTVTLDECAASPAPNDRKIVLTFDDGSVTVLKNAAPAMAAAGFTAINYLVADLIGGTNMWDTVNGEVPDRLMDDAQVRDWLAAGHEIGSHTRSHPRLSKIPPDKAREEIFDSKKMLEDRFGIPIRHFCYPYGDLSPLVRDLVAEAGYATAVTTEWGVCQPGGDPLLIHRIGARAHSLNFRNVFRRLTGQPLGD